MAGMNSKMNLLTVLYASKKDQSSKKTTSNTNPKLFKFFFFWPDGNRFFISKMEIFLIHSGLNVILFFSSKSFLFFNPFSPASAQIRGGSDIDDFLRGLLFRKVVRRSNLVSTQIATIVGTISTPTHTSHKPSRTSALVAIGQRLIDSTDSTGIR